MIQIDYPYQFNPAGLTSTASEDEHLRDLIEQVLFTSPGERVNRPDFGSGLLQLVFAPNSEELATATQFLVQGALQRWLGDRLTVEAVRVASDDSTLRVSVQYIVLRTQQRRVDEFQREVSL
jgi:phage baseplate assembly protein W